MKKLFHACALAALLIAGAAGAMTRGGGSGAAANIPATANANQAYRGPCSGSAAAPTFRADCVNDLPVGAEQTANKSQAGATVPSGYIGADSNGNVPNQLLNSTGGGSVSGSKVLILAAYFEQRVPMILPSSGSFGNNGSLTLNTALDTTFANAFMYFPAGAICSGSAAGWRYVAMSSTTLGTVYQDTYSSGVPAVPGSPIAWSCTGPGAYTQATTEIQGLTYTIPANAMGASGLLKSILLDGYPNNANTKTVRYYFGGLQVGSYQDTAHTQSQPEHVVRNISTGVQIAGNYVLNQQATGTFFKRTVDTTGSQTYYLTMQLANAADFIEMLASDVEVKQ